MPESNVLSKFETLGAAFNSLARGNPTTPRELSVAAMQRGAHYAAHREEIGQVLNSTSVATELKRAAILQDVVLDFAKILAPLSAFSTVFSNVPLQGTDKIEVPFYDLDTTSPTAWDPATGYVSSSTVVDKREISVNKRPHLGAVYSSEDIARQPFLSLVTTMQLKARQLAYAVWGDVLSVVTAANYGSAVLAQPIEAYDSDDLSDLKLACKTWPMAGRTLMVNSEVDAQLMKDTSFKLSLNAASDSVIKEGRLYPRVFGFDYVENPNIPTNAEDLCGFAVFKSAVLIAFSPIAPSEEVVRSGTAFSMVTDPASGISLQTRAFGNNVLDRSERYVECSYGFAKGNANALKRLTLS